jgi:hypothetical protein
MSKLLLHKALRAPDESADEIIVIERVEIHPSGICATAAYNISPPRRVTSARPCIVPTPVWLETKDVTKRVIRIPLVRRSEYSTATSNLRVYGAPPRREVLITS